MKKIILFSLIFVGFQIPNKLNAQSIFPDIKINDNYLKIDEVSFLQMAEKISFYNLELNKEETITYLNQLKNSDSELYVPFDIDGRLDWRANFILGDGTNRFDAVKYEYGKILCDTFNDVTDDIKFSIEECDYKVVEGKVYKYLEVETKIYSEFQDKLLIGKQFLLEYRGKRYFIISKTLTSSTELNQLINLN